MHSACQLRFYRTSYDCGKVVKNCRKTSLFARARKRPRSHNWWQRGHVGRQLASRRVTAEPRLGGRRCLAVVSIRCVAASGVPSSVPAWCRPGSCRYGRRGRFHRTAAPSPGATSSRRYPASRYLELPRIRCSADRCALQTSAPRTCRPVGRFAAGRWRSARTPPLPVGAARRAGEWVALRPRSALLVGSIEYSSARSPK